METQNEQTQEQVIEPTEQQTVAINQDMLNLYIERLRLEQNLPLGITSGLIVAIVSGVLWAAITVATKYQIGYMAIGVGFLVGFSIRYFGKGIDTIFGISGAVLSLFGCLLGNYLSIIGFYANEEGLGYFETLTQINLGLIPAIMTETFSPIDVLFYGLAIYFGYKFSIRQISDQEVVENAAQ